MDPAAKPEILYVTLSLDLGGTERHLAKLTARLAAQGWPVSVFCISRLGQQADEVCEAGVQIIAPPLAADPGNHTRVKRALYAVAAAVKLFWVLVFKRPGIVHFFLPEPYLIGAPLAILARTPLKLMSRRSLNVYHKTWPWARWIERHLHRRMNVVLGNSRRVTSQLIEEEGCAPEKVGLIYNGVDVEQFGEVESRNAMRETLGICANQFTAIIVANLIPYKGHSDLITGLSRVADRLPDDWTLLCVGDGPGWQKELHRMVAAHDLQEHVRFLGRRTDIPQLLSAADLAILCSHEEGFSNAILEAMAAGLPLVVSDVGGNAEAVIDGATGLVVPAHAPLQLGLAIATLAQDPVLAQRLGAAGMRRAREEFSMETCVSRYEQLYLGLADGKLPFQIIATASGGSAD